MTDADRKMLLRRADAGQPVSFLDDYPDLPFDVGTFWEAYAKLRNSTPGDQPISFGAKIEAWNLYRWEDFDTFTRFVDSLESVYAEFRNEMLENETKRRAARSNRPATRSPREVIGRPNKSDD